jgi:hypothetical protein
MPIIDGIIEGAPQFNTDEKAGIDVSLVRGAFYAVDDVTALNAISVNRVNINQIVWVQEEGKNYQADIIPPNYGYDENWNQLPDEEYTDVETVSWTEFTGFGSSEPGALTDPLSIGGLTVNPGNVGTTLTLTTGSDGSSALTIEGKNGGNILLITSGGTTPITVNGQGVIVLEEYTYTPTIVDGGIHYRGGNFYLGTPDPPEEEEEEE